MKAYIMLVFTHLVGIFSKVGIEVLEIRKLGFCVSVLKIYTLALMVVIISSGLLHTMPTEMSFALSTNHVKASPILFDRYLA